MAQCFPTYARDYPALVKHLKALVKDNYTELVPEAWQVIIDANNFIEKANQLDHILKDAEQRKQNKGLPTDSWQICADPHITVPHATVPLLQKGINNLRAKRLALADQNQATFESILESQATAEKIEARLKQFTADFEASMELLAAVDFDAMAQLQERILEATPV